MSVVDMLSTLRDSRLVIAIVDDEQSVCKALGRLFRSAGHEVRAYASAQDFLDSLQTRIPDCLVLDLHMPGLTGLDVLSRLKNTSLSLRTVVITGHDEPGMNEQVLRAGAVAYLLKPLDDVILLSAVQSPAHR